MAWLPNGRGRHRGLTAAACSGQPDDQGNGRLLAVRYILCNEGERGFGHFTPSMVNGQRMPTPRDFSKLGDRGIVFLQLVSSVDNRRGDRMVFLTRDEQEWPTLGVLGVYAVFRPRVEVGRGRLKERCTGSGDRKRVVELVGFVFLDRVGKAVTELLEGQ